MDAQEIVKAIAADLRTKIKDEVIEEGNNPDRKKKKFIGIEAENELELLPGAQFFTTKINLGAFSMKLEDNAGADAMRMAKETMNYLMETNPSVWGADGRKALNLEALSEAGDYWVRPIVLELAFSK